ncbi:hypothetical protein D1013_12330 [Euzebyella marina]|uniref:Quercetin 2,3-dioxygenase C-terminal cupin domain-containing protein n=1 Tax=Euzebyella marina TaxID=1761453 RepID=A0A3G2L757_9FLAO|nr:hypothetical protein [Euzebyella marina]AYN68102.1 hypothetical protein D1013_12330 [Euzebyella marina]
MTFVQKARIFKSFQRESLLSRTNECKSVPCGNYAHELGILKNFDDEIVAPNATKSYRMVAGESMIIFPLVESFKVEFNNKTVSLKPEELIIIPHSETPTLNIINAHQSKLINYLIIKVEKELNFNHIKSNYLKYNYFNDLFKSESLNISFGVFDGREEATYQMTSPHHLLFTHVINGAFEFQNRLLESKDSLSLEGFDTVEMESLSENAIILLCELSSSALNTVN